MEARFLCYDHESSYIERDEEYVSIFSGYSKVHDSLIYLERLEEVEEENGRNLDPYLKDDIHTLRLMLKILIPFVGCISNWKTKHQYLEVLLHPLACVLENVIQECEVFGRESVHFSGAEDLKPCSHAAGFTNFNLVKLKLVRAGMRKLYFVVSRSANPLTTGIGKEAVRFINSLVEILNDIILLEADLVILLKEQIETLRDKLMFLGNFLGFLSEICISGMILVDLLTCAEAMAVDATCVLYFILVDKTKGADMVQQNKIELLHVLEKILPFMPDAQSGIYFLALEASRSMPGPFVLGEYVLGFFDSLIHTLRQISNKNNDFEVALKEQIGNLLEELSSVRCYIEERPSHNYKEGLDNFTTELLDLIIDLGCFISSYEGLKTEVKLGDLLDKIQFIKSASGVLLIPRSWQYNFPRTNELGFIDFILVNLREQLQLNASSTDLFKCLFDTVYEELVALKHEFGEIAELCKENKELGALFTHYKDVAYQVEYFVDFSPSGAGYQILGLTDLRESIRRIHREVRAVTVKLTSYNQFYHVADSPGGVSVEAIPASIVATVPHKDAAGSHTDKAADLVGLENEIKKIKEHLIGGPKQLNILSIVGMPGIGKTTLADSVYRDPAVTLHFHASAWCSVSQVYQKENMLLDILLQVRRKTNQDDRENESDFDQQVYQSLKGRRYLVVLDDIWDTKVWDDLRPCFPEDCHGSRVMLTTRNHYVALHANSVPYALRLLSEKKSLKLLLVKVFEKETCPIELWNVGKKIALDCKGLPLSIVLIAGVLKTTERTQDCWERVAKELRTYVADYASGQQLGTLELSYLHLPDYLKPCFLYFGAFPEDAEIPVQRLARLWVAEGFVQQPKVDQSSLEYEAENYLDSLIDRSLVIIAKRSSRGSVKACRVHDLLYDFCLDRAEEERFLSQIDMYDELPTFRISQMQEQYRLSICSHFIPSVGKGLFMSRVRTLLFSGSIPRRYSGAKGDSYSIPKRLMKRFSMSRLSSQRLTAADRDTYSIPKGSMRSWLLFGSHRGSSDTADRADQDNSLWSVMDKFRLLRVLDLGFFEIGDEHVFVKISELVHLRYLCITASIPKIPAEVAKLKNLETFLLRTRLALVLSLETIWNLSNLRHLCILPYTFDFLIERPNVFEEIQQMESLTTLSAPRFCFDKDIGKMMSSLANLQKLKCVFLDSWDPVKSCNNFPVLDYLIRLESLKVSFSGEGLYPCNLSFPSSIKKLTLRRSCLPWNEISIVGRLPNLEALKLLDGAFEGPEWNLKDGEFQQLKYLKLDSLDIAIWNASSEHLPQLEQLLLQNCHYLKEIPSVFGEILTLRMIDMKWCSLSARDSVLKIEEEQHEMGNDLLNVFISL